MRLETISHGYSVFRVTCEEDLRRAQRLRYAVFCEEMGAEGDHEHQLERDVYDQYAQHFIAVYNGEVVGTARVMGPEAAAVCGGFYTAAEFSLERLTLQKLRIAEIGRSCVAAAHRSGLALQLLWREILTFCREEAFEVIVGTASFAGTCLERHNAGLQLLLSEFPADPSLAPESLTDDVKGLRPVWQLSRREALLDVPPLVKAYLRYGARIGQGIYIDHKFNTIDVCVIFDQRKDKALS